MAGLCGDEAAELVLKKYEKLKFSLNRPGEWTVLAGIVQYSQNSGIESAKVVALATGVKCIPLNVFKEYPGLGNQLVRDCHAEVLARRAFRLYLLKQIVRCREGNLSSIFQSISAAKVNLQDGLKFALYISHAPCGDATMHTIPLRTEELTRDGLVDTGSKKQKILIRGRESANRLGSLRTKPSRGDAPDAPYLSCSDKIALWSVIGWEGALLSALLEHSIFIETVICGDYFCEASIKVGILEKIEKCYSVLDLNCPPIPTFQSTNVPFQHSKSVVKKATGTDPTPTGRCLVWYDEGNDEVLTDGRKLGSKPPKSGILQSKCQSSISSQRYSELVQSLEKNLTKQQAVKYQKLKSRLFTSEDSPCYGWPSINSDMNAFRLALAKQFHNSE